MPHPPELIERIRGLVAKDYPPSEYEYLFEKFLAAKAKARMLPDIQVVDRVGKIHCAVEIGYTRPEKLTYYRKVMKIPDVRWYDKAGRLHTEFERTVVKRTAVIELAPRGPFTVWMAREVTWGCPSSECSEEGDRLSLLRERYERRFLKGRRRHPPGLSRLAEREEEILEDTRACTMAYLITDEILGFEICFCDKCGEVWQPCEYESLAMELCDQEPRDWHHWAQRWALPEGEERSIVMDCLNLSPAPRPRDYSWPEVQESVAQLFGMELKYEDGIRMLDDVDHKLASARSVLLRMKGLDDEEEEDAAAAEERGARGDVVRSAPRDLAPAELARAREAAERLSEDLLGDTDHYFTMHRRLDDVPKKTGVRSAEPEGEGDL